MDDFHVILDELDKMETASRKRDRERRRRYLERQRRKRRKKRASLLFLLICGVLCAPLLASVFARLQSFGAVQADPLGAVVTQVPDDFSPARTSSPVLVGDITETVDYAGNPENWLPETVDYVAERPENLLPGQTVTENPENWLPGQTATENPENWLPGQTVTENPENWLPGQTVTENPENLPPVQTASETPKNAVSGGNWEASGTTDYLAENPENLLPGQDSMILTRNNRNATSDSFTISRNAKTITLGESAEIGSQYAVLLDADTGHIYAERSSDVRVSPASMTKVLTLLVAVEKLIKVTPEGVQGMSAKVTVTRPVTNYCYTNNCSVAGFSTWETVTVRDLLYGCILPSGADACLALARHISGSQEDFVVLMNQKLEQLGISKTAHFTNCIGLYNKDHYCTMRDMAVIMRAAMDNSICRVILNARTFRTSSTAEHPNGISLSNLFLRRIEDRFTDTNLAIRGAKTGYVNQSGNCAVSYAVRADGKRFICVTGKAAGSWRAIYDHTLLYRAYCLN